MGDVAGARVPHEGLGLRVVALKQSRMDGSTSLTLEWALPRNDYSPRVDKQCSTRFSHDAELGVKCTWSRECAAIHAWKASAMWMPQLSRMRWTLRSVGTSPRHRGQGRRVTAQPTDSSMQSPAYQPQSTGSRGQEAIEQKTSEVRELHCFFNHLGRACKEPDQLNNPTCP